MLAGAEALRPHTQTSRSIGDRCVTPIDPIPPPLFSRSALVSQELKRALGDQLAVCSTAMVLHAELIPDEMGALHEHLASVLETYAAEITPLISAEA